MPQYYTPNLDEFHVGFEYEDYEDGEYIKKVVQVTDCLEDFNVMGLRVKFLEEEDILSLGWAKRNNSAWLEKDAYKCRLGNKFEIRGLDNNIFTGIVKNKSCLIRLMIQLNILTI